MDEKGIVALRFELNVKNRPVWTVTNRVLPCSNIVPGLFPVGIPEINLLAV